MFPHDGSHIIDGLTDLTKVAAVSHVAPDQHTQEGNIQPENGRLRERLDPQHVQDTGDEVGDSHHSEEHRRRAVSVQDMFALVSLQERFVGFRYLLTQSLLKLSAEGLASHLACVVELHDTDISQLLVPGLQLLWSKVRRLCSTQLRERNNMMFICIPALDTHMYTCILYNVYTCIPIGVYWQKLHFT